MLRPRPLWRAGPHADLRRLPVSLNLRAISLAEGMRAALAVASVMVLAEWLGRPEFGETALGALLTCLCDAGGPIRRRVPALLGFAAAASTLTVVLPVLHHISLWAAVPAATLLILLLAFGQVWGQQSMQVCNLLIVVTVLALDHAVPWRAALPLALYFALGSLWATALTMVIWRVHPYRPARQALAEVFRRMGALVADLAQLLDGADPAAWADHARGHRRYVRDGLEAARIQVFDTIRIRGSSSPRAAQSLIQLEAADQLFGVLIALSDVLEHEGEAGRATARKALPALRLLLAQLADATARDHATDDPAQKAAAERLLSALSLMETVPALHRLAIAASNRIRVALLLTTPEGLVPGADPSVGRPPPWWQRVWGPLRANLRWRSAIFRHALRAGVVAGPALAFTLSRGETYGHWLTITLVLTLQPFFASTWQRALERSGGTILGGLIAAFLSLFVHGPMATALVLVPLAIAAFAFRAVSFGMFMATLTPMVVLLADLGRPGESEAMIAAARAMYTVIGGGLAIVSGALLWPSWEPVRVRDALRKAIQAHADYTSLELAALVEPGSVTAAALESTRRTAGVATNTLETALNRALQEPRRALDVESAMAIDAALRRLAGRLVALQYDPGQAGTDRTLIAAWHDWCAEAFEAVLAQRKLPAKPPPDAGHPALGRIARQVVLIAGAMERPDPEDATPATPAPAPAP